MTPREQIQKRIDEMRAARERYDDVFDTSFIPTVHAELPAILNALETLVIACVQISGAHEGSDGAMLAGDAQEALAQAAKDLGAADE